MLFSSFCLSLAHRGHLAREIEMQAMWVSIKGNLKCGSKLSDVIDPRSEMPNLKDEEDEEEDGGSVKSSERKSGVFNRMENTTCNVMVTKKSFDKTRFFELCNGDPSRSIIEKIILASAPQTLKNPRKAKRVFRINNPADTLKKFERYREMVKQIAYLQYKSHPRNLVDGNELLLFYGTTMTCCSRRRNSLGLVSELCSDTNCGVCRIIEWNFNTEDTRKNGIRLSRTSQALVGNEKLNGGVFGKGNKSVKRAVIICRTIAGSRCIEEKDLFRSTEGITVQSPNAVLPCFVIVF